MAPVWGEEIKECGWENTVSPTLDSSLLDAGLLDEHEWYDGTRTICMRVEGDVNVLKGKVKKDIDEHDTSWLAGGESTAANILNKGLMDTLNIVEENNSEFGAFARVVIFCGKQAIGQFNNLPIYWPGTVKQLTKVAEFNLDCKVVAIGSVSNPVLYSEHRRNSGWTFQPRSK